LERAAILSDGSVLEAHDFPSLSAIEPALRCRIGGPFSLYALEKAHIQMVVANAASLKEAARILKIDQSTLYRKRKRIGPGVAKSPRAPKTVPPPRLREAGDGSLYRVTKLLR